jgi:hypothetical protein
MTIEAWAYSENGTANSKRIACKDPQGTVGKFILWKDASGDLEFMVANDSAVWSRIQGNPVSDGAWVHVVGVFDAVGQEVRLYENGFEVNSMTTGSIILNSTLETFTIGAASNNTHFWNGSIDEVRVSNTARSAEWIATSYNNQNAPSSFYGIGTLELPCTLDTDCGVCEKCDTISGSCVLQTASEDEKLECSDSDLCLTGFCDGNGACGVQDSGTACDDSDACTTSDACDGSGSCVGGPAPNCDDGNVCTTDSCDSVTGCVNANNTVPCDDNDECTTSDTCSAGVCVGGSAPNCDDGNVCTTDS